MAANSACPVYSATRIDPRGEGIVEGPHALTSAWLNLLTERQLDARRQRS